ncbi:MAG: T9SS type A sorting domain-containing protein [Chitinophagales bacterium]|nr:T9SS type A sorting domain-containing protein [Chitinophagales bacterium]
MKHIFALLLCAASVSLTQFNASAQAGTVDLTYYQGMGVDFKCTGGLVQPDSSVIIIGRFAWVNERAISGVAKLNQQGDNDYSFDIGTGADEHVNQIVRQPDGKLIIAGDFKNFNGELVNHIVRLNPDGSRDYSFNMGSGFTANGTVYALYLQPDGKILAGGIFVDYNGTTANYLVRLNNDGSIDNTFNIGTGFNNTVYDIDRQTDGKYIVAGNFTTVNGDTLYKRIVRLNTNGSIDATFNPGKGFSNIVTRAKLQSDGKIVAVGFFTSYNDSARSRIARIDTNGNLDVNFNPGTGFNSNVNDVLLHTDGKIYATGNFTQYNGSGNNRIVRINTTGSKDMTFTPGTGLNLSCNAIFQNYDGRVFVGGTFTAADSFARFRLVRFLTTGKVDHTFLEQSKLNNLVYSAATQSSGKAVIGGTFTRYNQRMANRITRLNSDGMIDTTFKSGTGANNNIRKIVVLPNDKILIGGDFTTYNGVARNRIARLNADGSLDTSFVVGTGANATVYAFAVDAQGKIYVGGNFATFNGTTVNRIVRLNSNGSIDNTFDMGTGFNNYVYEIVLQPDGKILASGAFTNYKGVSNNRIIRLNTDGTPDNTFTIGTGAGNIVYSIELMDSGRILIGGTFTTYNGTSKLRVALLNTNGTLNTSFAATVANGAVFDIRRIDKGVLLGGSFTSVNGVTGRNRIICLDSTGAVNNSTFYTGIGSDNIIYTVHYDALQRAIYLGGTFSTIQSKLYNRFARLTNSSIKLVDIATLLCPGAIPKVYFEKNGIYNPGNVFTVQLSDANGSFANPTTIGAKPSTALGLDSITVFFPNNLPHGTNYRVRIVSSDLDDISNLSQAITVTNPQIPTVTASGPLDFCSGGSGVTLSASEGTSYSWSSGETTQSIVVQATGSYIVTVNSNNCIASSAPVNTVAHPSPDSSIVIEIASLCGSGSVKLSGKPGLTYAWNIGPTSQSITVSQNGVYALTVTDTIGCQSDSTLNLNITDLLNNLIVANGPTTFCQGNSVTLTTLPGANSYLWSNSQTTQSINVTTAGSYSLTVSDGICSVTDGPVTVTVLSLPTITFSLPQDTFCQSGSSVTLSATPVGGTFSGNGVSGSTFNPAGLGNTSVVVTYTYTDGNNCTNTKADTVYVALCTGIEDVAENTLHIFPNPVNDVLYIAGLKQDTYLIEITNMLGATVLSRRVTATSGTEMLNLKELTAGQYVIRAGNSRTVFVKQ